MGTKFSFEFILKVDSTDASAKIFDFGDGGIFSIEHNTIGLQVKSASSGWVTIQSPSMLADLAIHHMVVTVDNTALKLYDNGNEVAAITIAAPDIDSCADARIGTYFDFAASECFHGTIYRARFYNHSLSSAEVRTAFERSDVNWSDQYGSMSEKIGNADNRTFSGGSTNWSAVGITPVIDSGALKFPQTSAFAGGSNDLAAFGNRGWLYKTYFNTGPSHTTGKRYRFTLDTKAETAGSKLFFNIQHGSTTPTNLNQSVTLTTSFATYSFDVDSTHEYTASSDYILLGLDAAE